MYFTNTSLKCNINTQVHMLKSWHDKVYFIFISEYVHKIYI